MEEKKLTHEEVYLKGQDCSGKGLNCAECTFKTLLESGFLGDYPPEIVSVASGFGGGLARKRELCGAVVGGALGLGLMKGRKDLLTAEKDKETRQNELDCEGGIYDIFYAYADEIEKRYGALSCGKLIGKWLEKDEFKSPDRAKFCKELIGFCTKTAYKYATK